jgi:hypothetical protein
MVSYEIFLSLCLTVLCVILAALGTIIAIAAIRGFQSIKDAASASAVEAVDKAVKKAIEEQFGLESMRETIKNIIDEKLETEADIGLALIMEKMAKENNKTGSVAENYPGSNERDNNESP